MSCTIERTPFKWEKGRGDKCCCGLESCLACVRPVLGATVIEWHMRLWDGCLKAQRQGDVYLCQGAGEIVVRGSGFAHCCSHKLGNPGIASVWDLSCRQQQLSPKLFISKTTTRMWLQKSFVFNCTCTGYNIINGADLH